MQTETLLKNKLEKVNKKTKSIERLEKALNKKNIEKSWLIEKPKETTKKTLTKKKEIIRKKEIIKKTEIKRTSI